MFSDPSSGNYEGLYANKTPDGEWSTPVNLSNYSTAYGEPVIAVANDGTLHVAWYSANTHPEHILYATRPPGGIWTAPISISGPLTNSAWPHLAVDATGTVHAVWNDPHNTGPAEVWYTSRATDGSWSAPVNLSNSPSVWSGPQYVGVCPDGTIHAVWTERLSGGSRIYYSAKPPAGVWSTPVNITPVLPPRITGTDVSALAVGSDGTLHVGVEGWRTDGDGEPLYLNKRSGSSWSAVESISGGTPTGSRMHLTIDDSGTVHAVWPAGSPTEVYYARKSQGGVWTTPLNLSNTVTSSVWPFVAAGSSSSSNEVHVAWQENVDPAGGNAEIFYTFNTTSTGPPDIALTAADITFGSTSPTEGDTMPITATLHNTSTVDSGPLTVAFFATPPAGFGETYIGAAFVPSVPVSDTTEASIQWNTLGFAGDVPVRVVVDPFGRLLETNEDNNEATTNVTIRTRPALHVPWDPVPAIDLSDPEPVAGQAVTVTLTLSNTGETDAGESLTAL